MFTPQTLSKINSANLATLPKVWGRPSSQKPSCISIPILIGINDLLCHSSSASIEKMAPKRKRQQQSTPKIKPTKRVKDGLALLKTEWSAYPWTDDLLKQLTRSFPSWCVELIVLLFGYCNDPRQRSLLVPYIDRIND